MLCSSLKEKTGSVMNPHIYIAHLFGRWLYDFTFFRSIIFDIASAVLNKSVKPLGNNCTRAVNSCNLSSQVYFLILEVEGVRIDLFIQVPAEHALNLSRLYNLTGLDVWQLGPRIRSR